MQDAPRVSIGLPVYNGERYIGRAIESVLAQTYPHWQLIICDNASSDKTGAICRRFAQENAQIRYYRNERNLGAGPNYNRVFALSGETDYFKWLAHDDEMAPTFLEHCVTALDQAPDAVLCQTLIADIDETGAQISTYDSRLIACRTQARPALRFEEAILTSHRNVEIFGLVRRAAMVGSVLHGDYYLSDRAFVVEMSLRGRFLHLAEPLMRYRSHATQYTRALRLFDTLDWLNTTPNRWNRAAYLVLYANYIRMIRRNLAQPGEQLRALRALLRWWFCLKNAQITLAGCVAAASPWSYRQLRSAADWCFAHFAGEPPRQKGYL